MILQPLKILLLRSHAGYYGVERMVVELAKGLKECGHHPCIGIIGRSEETDQNLLEACRQNKLDHRLFMSQSPTDQRTVTSIRKMAKEFMPHVIHSHGYKADILAWLANRSLHYPLLSTCHPWLGTHNSARMWLYACLDKLVLTRFNDVVAISEKVKADCRLGPVRRKQIRVIANGLDLNMNGHGKFTGIARQKMDFTPKSFIIGAVGRLSREKGQRILLSAFAALCRQSNRPLVLVLAGDGPDRPHLESQASELGIGGRVRFLGYHRDIPELLACMDIFVMPSLSEGLPLALLEAMAAARPIIAADVGEIGQVLENGAAGVLVAPGDSDQLYQALAEIIEQPERCKTLACRAQERARNTYSRLGMTVQYEQVYRSLLNRKEQTTHAA